MRTFAIVLAFSMISSAGDLHITRDAVPERPFTVTGEHGAFLGRQSGTLEAWQWPVKIFSELKLTAELADYPVPIDVNKLAASVDVRPAETVVSYSHAAFTIRQHMLGVRGPSANRLGTILDFEIDAIRPLDVTFSFTPELKRMWPAAIYGRPDADWKDGFYVLSSGDPNLSAVIGMPNAQPGILVPYQEHAQTYPLQFKIHFDPKNGPQTLPLLFALRDQQPAADQMKQLLATAKQARTETEAYYAHFFDHRLSVETPDTHLNEAAQWAELSIDQAQVAYSDGTIGLVAGLYESGDSARPGFAWFFGRDTLWTTYAINSYGDFALTKRALDFLFARQRADGKIMHEFSQGAAFVDWSATPYFYASADSTCLLVMAMRDYVATSGDEDYLKLHWEAVKRAYAFTREHDSDGDGIYDNSQGTGWVESWPGAMPHQEIYLAALDEESSLAMKQLAAWMKDDSATQQAGAAAHAIATAIEREYQDPSGFWAFSYNPDHSTDKTATIYPAVAWWDGGYALRDSDSMLNRWASAEFSTDWGTRDISDRTPSYDPISYHQGSVWPLFTGWVSLAEYRAGRSLSGYAHLMQNVNLTWAQDLGAVTELLSGRFFRPLGRSTSHQLWSSAMVLTPLLRGMFGLAWDASSHTLYVAPNLPATWNTAKLKNVPLGNDWLNLDFERRGAHWLVTGHSQSKQRICLRSPESQTACSETLEIASPPIELALPAELPVPGAETSQLKATGQQISEHTATFSFEGMSGTAYHLPVRINKSGAKVEGGALESDHLVLRFAGSRGYQPATVVFRW